MATEVIQSLSGGNTVAVKSFSNMSSKREVSFNIACATADVADVMVLPDLERTLRTGTGASPTHDTNITFTSAQLNKDSRALGRFYALIGITRFSCTGMRIFTSEASSGTANLDGILTFTKIQPDGQKTYATFSLSTLKENTGSGFSPTLLLDYDFIKDEKVSVSLSNIKVSTNMTFTLLLDAVNDAHDFIPIGAQIL